jgi:hypothetical protein
VIEATGRLADARARLSAIRGEEKALQADLAECERAEAIADKFLAEAAPIATDATSADQVRLRHELARASVDRTNAQARRAVINQQIADLARRAREEQARMEQILATPFGRAINGAVTVAFAPYANHAARPGAPLFACSWGLIRCRQVGTVTESVDGELQEPHPHDQRLHRGVMFVIELSSSAGRTADVLFAGRKPFLF